MFQTLDCFSLLLPQIRPLIPPDSSSLKMRFCNFFYLMSLILLVVPWALEAFVYLALDRQETPPLEKTGFLKRIKCIGCHTGPYLDRKILQSSVPFRYLSFPSHKFLQTVSSILLHKLQHFPLWRPLSLTSFCHSGWLVKYGLSRRLQSLLSSLLVSGIRASLGTRNLKNKI